MAITYTWNFGPLETKLVDNDLTNVVNNVHYQLYAVDDDSGAQSKNIGVAYLVRPKSGSFINFDDLTEEVVKGWVLNSLAQPQGEEAIMETAEEVELRLQQSLATRIEEINDPPIVEKKAPWLPAE